MYICSTKWNAFVQIRKYICGVSVLSFDKSICGPVIPINEGDGLFWGTTTIGRVIGSAFCTKKPQRTNLISDLDSKITDCAFEVTWLHLQFYKYDHFMRFGGMYPNIGRNNPQTRMVCMFRFVESVCLFPAWLSVARITLMITLITLKEVKETEAPYSFSRLWVRPGPGRDRESSSQCKNSTVLAEGS